MIHPLLRLAAAQPMLLIGHVGAYAELASQEMLNSVAVVQRRLLWQLAGALSLTVAAVLAGVALLLWAWVPAAGMAAQWLLVVTPLVPAVLGLWALWRARLHRSVEPFALLHAQLAEDAVLLSLHTAP